MEVRIGIRPSKFTKFLGRTVGRTYIATCAGTRAFKTEFKRSWAEHAPPQKPAAPEGRGGFSAAVS